MLAILILSVMLFLVFQPLLRWPPTGLWLKRRPGWLLAVGANRHLTGLGLAALRSRVRALVLRCLRYRGGAGVLALCRANQL